MKKTTLILFLVLSHLFVSAASRPNIVYLFADDLGWAGIRANQKIAAENGADMSEISKIITPNIDKLVESGINFTHYYSNSVCSPSRSSQQLGFHQGHTWADWNDPSDDKAMRTQDPTIGKVLAEAGYRNGMYGKWGYGATKDKLNPKIVNEQTLPINHGYHDCVVELHHVRAHTFLQPSLWYSHVAADGTVEMDTTLVDNKKMFPEEELYADNYYTAGAIKFIREEASGPSPFFIQVSFQIPHGPFDEIDTLSGWFDDYKDVDTSNWEHNIKQYAANMVLLDKLIGRIMAALRDPNNDGDESDSIMKNTLIIFASDNGGGGYPELRYFNGNGHLANYKGTVQEGGIRDPLVFAWEGVIEPGTATDHKTCVTDMFPTFCELAGVKPPVGLDGSSIAPLLTGKGDLRKRPYFCYEAPGGKSWYWSIVKGDMKLGKAKDGTLHLYDLDKDESEKNNLADNPRYADVVSELLKLAMEENLEAEDLYANVWPTWIGEDGANVNDAASWKETGTWNFEKKWPTPATPTGSWNAVVKNSTKKNKTAYLETSISTLGFEVAGNAKTGASMSLELLQGVSLTGRNEIRLSSGSEVILNGGILESVRWVDILENATLKGSGMVDTSLYNQGTLEISMGSRKKAGKIMISGDYTQSKEGVLNIDLTRTIPLVAGGKAILKGSLVLSEAKGLTLKKGQRLTVLKASSIAGKFSNAKNTVDCGDQKFRIVYGNNTVELEKLN